MTSPSLISTEFSLCQLTDWAIVSVQGADSTAYLQGQLTADLALLDKSQHQLAAHCDAKGKMWSDLRIFHSGEGYRYILRRNVQSQQVTELKKYAVFSKVTIMADDNYSLIGVLGRDATTQLARYFPELPDATRPVVTTGTTTLLWLADPNERYLIIAEPSVATALTEYYASALADQTLWQAAEIAAGIPIIESVNSAQFIPQATNLQALDAISFKKGCYSGQEMVARAKYRGANKRAMYWLAGQAEQTVAAGDALELKMDDKWRKTGTVLSSVCLANGELWVQVVLNNDLAPDAILRPVGCEQIELQPQPLPYSLIEA